MYRITLKSSQIKFILNRVITRGRQYKVSRGSKSTRKAILHFLGIHRGARGIPRLLLRFLVITLADRSTNRPADDTIRILAVLVVTKNVAARHTVLFRALGIGAMSNVFPNPLGGSAVRRDITFFGLLLLALRGMPEE